jgi:hypothetical protein
VEILQRKIAAIPIIIMNMIRQQFVERLWSKIFPEFFKPVNPFF